MLVTKRNLDFEIEGILNPVVLYAEGSIPMFYRAVAHGNHPTICCSWVAFVLISLTLLLTELRTNIQEPC